MSQRLARLREAMVREGLEAILVSQSENRRYLSGFTGDAGVLLIDAEHALLATDFRYYEQVRQQAPAFDLVEANTAMPTVLAARVAEMGIHRLGFEDQTVTVRTFEELKAAMPTLEWAPLGAVVDGLRQVKEPAELAAMEGAVRIADEAMQHIMGWIRPGLTERQVAWELEVTMRTHGAEALSFTTIVGSGPNGAMAHAVTSERVLQQGDPVVIDMGAVYQGYCSDITRSFCVGQADDPYRRVWDTVLEAQLAAEKAIKAGMLGSEADAVARKIIYDAGYAGQFGHGLGHGVGLAIHEKPRAGQTSQDILQAGTIVTVEPGIYVPDWGGVRIEDMVVVTEEGCRVLTQSPKAPVSAGR